MQVLDVKIKKMNKDAIIPTFVHEGDAGLDLVAINKYRNLFYVEYDTGLALEIPYGYMGLIFPRSSISGTSLMLANSVGVIDENFRGSIKVRMFEKEGFVRIQKEYEVGDKVAQLIILPRIKVIFEEVTELTSTTRGLGSFGSTDVKSY